MALQEAFQVSGRGNNGEPNLKSEMIKENMPFTINIFPREFSQQKKNEPFPISLNTEGEFPAAVENQQRNYFEQPLFGVFPALFTFLIVFGCIVFLLFSYCCTLAIVIMH